MMTHIAVSLRHLHLAVYRFSNGRFLITCLLLASVDALAVRPIMLPEHSFNQTVTPYTSFYEDNTARLTLTEILNSNTQLSFTPTHTDSLKRGLTSGVVWVRLSVHNARGQSLSPILTLSKSRMDEVNLYDITNVNDPRELRDPEIEGSLGQAHAFSLNIRGNSTQSYLVRIKSDAPINTRISLKSLDQFNAKEQTTDILTGALMGLVTLILLYFMYARINGERGLIGPGLLCACSVLFFVPSSIGIYGNISIAQILPNGCIETFAVCGILASQQWALLQLGWRSLWIKAMLGAGIGFTVIIMASDVITPSYLTEWLLYGSSFFVQILTLLLTSRTHSRFPETHVYLRSSAIVLILGTSIVLMNTRTLIDFNLTDQLLVFLLPSFVIAGLFFGQVAIGLKRSRTDVLAESFILPEIMQPISQQFRAPIEGVIGMCELIDDTPLSMKQRDYLDTIKMASEDLQVLVSELSDLGHVKARDIQLNKQPCKVTELLNKTLAHFQREASRKQVELILDIAEDWPHQLFCDANRLQSILFSLVSRTLMHMEHGAITLHANYHKGKQTQGLHIHLQFTGTVINQQIFGSNLRTLQPSNPQLDGDNPDTWNLSVIRELLRHMHGTLDIESLNNQGGSVSLFLPMQVDHRHNKTSDQQDQSLYGLNALVVDDNATLRLVIEKQLRRWGMRSHSTYSGKEALAMLRTENRNGTPYDIVIVDQDMPVMSGLQLADRVRSDDDILNKPAILMLTNQSISNLNCAITSVDHVITKPVNSHRLYEALTMLERQPGSVTEYAAIQ